MRRMIWQGGSRFTFDETPDRPPRADEVQIQVEACGICGTDVHIIRGEFPLYRPPKVLGHEYAGRVVATGSSVDHVHVGDVVTVDPSTHSCGVCGYCRRGLPHLCPERAVFDGAFSETATVPAAAVHRLPPDLDPEAGALTEPVSCALHAVDRAEIASGSTALIFGAGTMGLLLLQLVLVSGVARAMVVEPIAFRRGLAARLGAERVIDPTAEDSVGASLSLTAGLGVDYAFEAAGKPELLQQAVESVRRGGTVVQVGVAPPKATVRIRPYQVYEKELTLRGSYIRLFDYPRAIAWLGRLHLKELVTHRVPLEALPEAIELTARSEGVKVLVKPGL